jgi:hypothetical protein
MEIITDNQRISDLADNIVARTHEVYNYDTNIQNYEALLTAYPTEWPAYLEQFKGMDPHQAAAECDAEFIDELAACQQAERVTYLLKTEKVERAKAAAILEVLKAQMPDNIEEAAITAAIARREAVLNQSM